MHFRLVAPMRRKGSSHHQFVKRVPADLKDRVAGRTFAISCGSWSKTFRVPQNGVIRFSLGTAEPSEVRERQAAVVGELERQFAAARQEKAFTLSHKEAVALSGEVYRAWATDIGTGRTLAWSEDGDGDGADEGDDLMIVYTAGAALMKRLDPDDREGLEANFGPILDKLLVRRGRFPLDPASRVVALREVHRAIRDGMEEGERKAGGDYSGDPKADRFPTWQDAAPTAGVSLSGLLGGWWKEAAADGRSERTLEAYQTAFNHLAAFLKHDDAGRLTTDDLLRYKDARLAAGKSTKTVKASDFAAFNSVFEWAVANNKLRHNPARAVRIKASRKPRLREASLNDAEVRAILRAASSYQKPAREGERLAAAKRWVPWLLAYTGARLGEMVQLRKEDVHEVGGTWCITISPEAGTVKDRDARTIPVHGDLIARGFLDFVRGSSGSYLFMNAENGGEVRGPLRTTKNRLREFVRLSVTDTNVQPNHGWRHRFKTIGRERGVNETTLDAFTGHAPQTEGAKYGEQGTLKAMVRAIALFPSIEVGPGLEMRIGGADDLEGEAEED